MANGHGGVRPNSGRPASPERLEIGRLIREFSLKPETLKHIFARAFVNDALLVALLHMGWGRPPQSVSLQVAVPQAERTVSIAGGKPHTPTATRVPGPGTLQ